MGTQVFEEPIFEEAKLVAEFNAPNCGHTPACSEGHQISMFVGTPYSITGSEKKTAYQKQDEVPFIYEEANIGHAAGHISNADCVGKNSCHGIMKPGTNIVGVNYHLRRCVKILGC